MRGPQDHHRGVQAAPALAGRAHADGGVRIEDFTALGEDFGDGFTGLHIVHGQGIEQLARFAPTVLVDTETATLLEGVHQPGDGRAVAPVQVEQQAFEVRRDHDVHGRRQGRVQGVLDVLVAAHEAVQDVVAVGRDDQLADRQAHVARQVAGEDIAEVAGRHRERHRTGRAAQLQGRVEVVDDLGHDPRPVDRVHRDQARALEEALVGEAVLDHFLAVVEVAFDGDVVDVVAEQGGHLPALHLGHPLVRVEDEDVDVLAMLAAFDGGRTGVTGGGADDHHALATFGQHVVEQATEQLQGEVLERQGRAVEQLQHPFVAVQLAQWGYGTVGESAVGFLKDLLEVRIRNAAGDERAHDPERQFVIRQAGPGSDFFLGEAWQVFRHIEAAVAGEARQQHVFEVQGRCLAAGTDVTHEKFLLIGSAGLVQVLDTDPHDWADHALQGLQRRNGVVDMLFPHAVGQQDHRHQAVVFFDFLLHDRFNADAALRQDARDLGQHTRMVLGLDAQVVGAFALFDRQDRVGRQRVRLEGQVRDTVFRVAGHGADHVHQVGDDRRGGRFHAGTGTVEQGRTCGIAIDHDRVHHAVDVGEQAIGRDQRRVHPQFDTGGGAPGHAQVLDAVAQGFGVVDVGGGQLGDAFGVGLVELQRDTESNGRQDRQLVRGIDAFDVEGRIGFGVTQGLGFGQHVFEGTTLLAHFGEDEVTGAVDDAGNPVDAVGRKAFANRLDHRDTAGHGGFERNDHALLAGLGEDFVTVHGDQRLVRGDHVLAVLDGAEHQLAGNGVAAHQLDDDIDFRVARHFEDIVGNRNTGGLELRLWRTHGNLSHFDSTPGTAGNLLGVTLKYVEGAATDGT